jgi:hypothetical protein
MVLRYKLRLDLIETISADIKKEAVKILTASLAFLKIQPLTG